MPRQPDAPSDPARRVGPFVLFSRETHNDSYRPAYDMLWPALNIATCRAGFVGFRALLGTRKNGPVLTQEHRRRLAATHSMSSRKVLGQFPRHTICNNHRGHGHGLPQRRVDAPTSPGWARRTSSCPEGVGLFMLRHCDRFRTSIDRRHPLGTVAQLEHEQCCSSRSSFQERG